MARFTKVCLRDGVQLNVLILAAGYKTSFRLTLAHAR